MLTCTTLPLLAPHPHYYPCILHPQHTFTSPPPPPTPPNPLISLPWPHHLCLCSSHCATPFPPRAIPAKMETGEWVKRLIADDTMSELSRVPQPRHTQRWKPLVSISLLLHETLPLFLPAPPTLPDSHAPFNYHPPRQPTAGVTDQNIAV